MNNETHQEQLQNHTQEKHPQSISSVSPLQRFLKPEKTNTIEYEIIKEMTKMIGNLNENTIDETFKTLYFKLSKDIKKTSAYELLNYHIWNQESICLEIRENTEFFDIVSEWIELYELKSVDLKTIKEKTEFLGQFFDKFTSNMFQKVILINEIDEDLMEMLGREFWGVESLEENQSSQRISANKEDASEVLKFITSLIACYSKLQPQTKTNYLFNTELYACKEKSQNYVNFILKSVEFILSVHDTKNNSSEYLEKHQEMELTKLTLIFLQRPNIPIESCIKIIKLLMLRTSKVVRLAMVVDYVAFYEYLERNKLEEILEELENMVYFRELIIGRSQIHEAGLIPNYIGKQFTSFSIPSRSKERILITNMHSFGEYSILELEILVEGGDIGLSFSYLNNGKEVQIWKEEKSEDRRVEIVLKEEGVYVLEVSNAHSWIKGKKVQYKIEMFCVGQNEIEE